MTIAELKEAIQDLPDDAEVRLAQQPRWAFEYEIGHTAYIENLENQSDPASLGAKAAAEDDEDDEDSTPPDFNGAPGIFYIGEGSQIGYLPGQATEELNWSR
jgi:hypothetical protein